MPWPLSKVVPHSGQALAGPPGRAIREQKRLAGLIAPLVATILVTRCGLAVPASVCKGPDAHPALYAQLLFGRSLHGGGEVSDAQWQAFLADTVTPRFPDGLTVVEGAGQWRAPATRAIVAERSKVLLLVVADTPGVREALEDTRAAYRARFGQESVGLVTSIACAAF